MAAEDNKASTNGTSSNGAGEDSATIGPERRAGLEKLAGYFEHPETAPWDWEVLRNVKSDAWRV